MFCSIGEFLARSLVGIGILLLFFFFAALALSTRRRTSISSFSFFLSLPFFDVFFLVVHLLLLPPLARSLFLYPSLTKKRPHLFFIRPVNF